MGKRSHRAAGSRKRKKDLEALLQMWTTLEGLKFQWFRSAALFARSEAQKGNTRAWSIEWITANCHTTEAEAAEAIALGEAILEAPLMRSPRRAPSIAFAREQ